MKLVRALGVVHVLEGTVHKAGDRIHVTTQLIDTRNDTQTWAETYDRDVADLFVIQNDISQEVVSRLKAALSPEEKAAVEEKRTDDKEAYNLYLRARALVYDFGGPGKALAEGAEKLSRCWSQPSPATPDSLSPTACSLMRI